ncbi:MAG: energy-coupling factor transporter transmembrane component T [Thermoplasmata archaeon]
MNGFSSETFDPRAKMFFVLIIIILAILIPLPIYLAVLLLIVLITALSGRILKRLISYLSPLKILIPLLLILNLFFYAHGEVVWKYDLRIFTLSVTRGGFKTSIMILLRFFVIASAAALFAVTTDPEKFERTLVKLKIPWKLAFIFSLTLRLVPDLKRRYKKIEEAQISRGLDLKGNPIKRIKARIPMIIPFMASVIRYGYDLSEALKARSFDEIKNRTYMIQLKHKARDYGLYLFSIILFVIYLFFYY